MDTSTSRSLNIGLIVVMFVLAVYGIMTFSGQIAVHFDTTGDPNQMMGVVPGMLLLPMLAIVLYLVFSYLPAIDPLGENYSSFDDVFEVFKVLITGVLAYVQVMIVAWNAGYQYDPAMMVVPIIFSVYYMTGEMMEQADRNWFIGIKTPWTLSSDDVWEKTHARTAPLLKLAAVIALVALVFPVYSIYFYAVPACLVALYATVYSYWVYRQEEKKEE